MGPAVPAPIADTRPVESVRARDAFFRRALLASDLAAVTAALLLTTTLAGHDLPRPEAIILVPVLLLLSKIGGLYDRDQALIDSDTTIDEIPALFNLATMLALVAAIGGEGAVPGGFSELDLLTLWMMLAILLIVFRIFARAFALRFTASERCIVIGNADVCAQLGLKLSDSPYANTTVLGYVSFKDTVREDDPAPLGGLEQLDEVLVANDVHRVIVALHDADPDAPIDAVRRIKALGVKLSVLPRIFEIVGSSVEFDDIEGLTVLGVRHLGLTRGALVAKRMLDITVGTATLIASAPFFAITAVAIKLDSTGPVFFRQPRVGRNGEVFEIVKFRTMIAGAEQAKKALLAPHDERHLFKLEGDPRITRVGRWLRRTSLDELPQLINVLRGEMGLVGPRPLVFDEDSRIEGWHRRRLHLKPGMTGPWQILTSGRVPIYEMVKIDYLYAIDWSVWTDVKILIRTFFYVLARRGM